MNYIYIIYYRYSNCEEAYIDGIYENLSAAKNAWKDGAIDFLRVRMPGEYRLVQLQKIEPIMKELEDFSSLDVSWIENNIENNKTMKVLEIADDADLYDVKHLYCKEHKLDEEDDFDIIEKLSKDEFYMYAERIWK